MLWENNRNHILKIITVIFLTTAFLILHFGCASNNLSKIDTDVRFNNYPPVILWAWERPEDLRFIDTEKIGVAFLSQTLILQNDDVKFIPRRQPLKILPKTYLIAVSRIETDKSLNLSLSDSQISQLVLRIRQTLDLPNVKALQIDFDAVISERNFYRRLMKDLRGQIPENIPLTMTALASWCASDGWFSDFPVDEAVSMAFQMGTDDNKVRSFLADGKDWSEPLCRSSYGIALNEPLKMTFQPKRRFYIFNNRPWQAEDLKNLPEGVLQ